MKKIQRSTSCLLVLAALTASSSATIIFIGGAGLDLDDIAAWEGRVFPVSGEAGIVDIDADFPDTTSASALSAGGDLIIGSATADNITLTVGRDLVASVPDSITFNNVTVNVDDDISTGVANGSVGNFIFNAGSVTNVDDDFEATSGGIITINGGTHTVGLTNSDGEFGATSGSTLNFFGGTVVADDFRVEDPFNGEPGGVTNIGGDATLTVGRVTIESGSTVGFSSLWTGSLTNTNATAGFWEDLLVSGDEALLNGAEIDQAVFDNNFLVSDDGLSLSLGVVAVPEPSSLTLLITLTGSTLDFTWNSSEAMEYDLVSTDDFEAEQDPSLWDIYDDGIRVFERIVSTGTGIQTLTEVQIVGPKRFFALIERPISAE